MRALVLVAHPDDEILFLGATMLQHPEWDWTVVSFTHEWHDWRGREFRESHEALLKANRDQGNTDAGSISHFMLGLPDEDQPEGDFIWWEDRLTEWRRVEGDNWDAVYTHNRVGEYGHPHHIAVNVIARRAYPDRPVWEFYYPPVVPGTSPLWWGDHEFRFEHDPRKVDVFHEAYGGHFSALEAHQPALIKFLLGANVDMVTR